MAMDELRDYLKGLHEEHLSQAVELRAAMARIPTGRLQSPIRPGEWSPHKILTHVVAAAEHALAPRLFRILAEEQPDLPDWDQDRWMEDNYDPAVPIDDLLAAFELGQAQVSDRLANVDFPDWNRSGRHPLRGQRTLLWWFEYLVGHNKEHIQQLQRGAE